MTQKDIAKMLGISRSTVSLALKGYPKISKETREKVIRLAKLTNYRPNFIAQNLLKGKTYTIGLMQAFPFSPFFIELTGKIHQLLRKHNYLCISVEIGSSMEFKESLEIFMARRVDALICLISFLDMDGMLQIKNEKIPSVFYNENPDLPADIVAVDTYKGGSLALEHLANLGHKKIGFIGKSRFESTDRRYMGYKNALERLGLEFNEDFVVTGYGGFQTGFEGMIRLLGLKDKPTAIIAHNDIVAIGALSAVYKEGLRVPHDIAIIGFDNIESSKYLNVPLTTIEFPIEKIAKKLVEILLFRLENNNSPAYKKFVFNPRLIIRESCGWRLKKGES
ncbi:MAG: LacI family transcriptional regulator [Candidatus Omnitrophica bacterium]|nr:LacI family transcriptional regulator [Candidatus Omnitrophota bacterium]